MSDRVAGGPKPDVSVVIVTWNAAHVLGPCLDALARHAADVVRQVIVVDNASTDGTVPLLLDRGFREVTEDAVFAHPYLLVRNWENVGFARANNQGLALARAPYVLFLNPDTEVQPDSVQRLAHFLHEHPDVAAVGPKLTNAAGVVQGGAAGHMPGLRTLLNYSLGLYALSPSRFPAIWLARRQYAGTAPIEVGWVSGAALMTRTVLAREVGGWPEDYFLYIEDIAFCERLQAHGRIVCLPAAHVVHHIGGSTHQTGTQGLERNVEGLDRYYRRHYGRVKVVLLHLVGGLGFALRWAGAILLGQRTPRGHSAPAVLLWRTLAQASVRYAWQTMRGRQIT